MPKGGWEPSDVELEAAASREALEEGPNLYSFSVSSCPDYGLSYSLLPFYHPFPLWTAGVRGTITKYVVTISTPSTTVHFYEMDVVGLDHDWVEANERRREWVDYAEAIKRLEWKAELAHALKSSSLAR